MSNFLYGWIYKRNFFTKKGKLKWENVFSSIILEIHAGAGGNDSKLFIEDLAQAYQKYSARHNLRCEVLEWNQNNVCMKITGDNVEERFEKENRSVCLQRIPPTEHNGRRHTSYLLVAILPCVEESEFQLDLSEVDIKATIGNVKAGGQASNKTANCIRATHKPTGLTCFIQTERSQQANKKEALIILASKVKNLYDKDKIKIKADKSERGGKGRTYNFIKNRAVDHVLNTKTTRVEDVIYKGMFELLH